jgi:type IV secretory pathway VirB2 component (pilin)
MQKNTLMLVLVLGLLLGVPTALAVDFNSTISSQDQQTFDQILAPVMKVYNFIKYAATVVAVLFLVFAGITFITSGSDQAKRESAKMMATYVVIGLIIIWVAPIIVSYLTK